METYKGVLVSSRAKKQTIKTLINTYAGRPSAKYARTLEVYRVSSWVKAPRSNNIWTIGKDKTYKPMAEGIDINKANSKDLFWSLLVISLSLDLIAFDKLGSNTTPSAIPKIAKGNWFNLSA